MYILYLYLIILFGLVVYHSVENQKATGSVPGSYVILTTGIAVKAYWCQSNLVTLGIDRVTKREYCRAAT